jgi:hypothetical protein
LLSSDLSQIAFALDREAGHGIERRRAYGFAREEVESGMVPRTPDCPTDDQPLIQRTAVVAADGTGCKYLIALPHQHNRFTIIVAQDWLVLDKCLDCYARLEVGSG